MKTTLERIHPTNALPSYLRLSSSARGEIIAFLEANPSVTIDSPRDVVDAYLQWNGIIGYTFDFIDVVLKAYDK